MQKIKNGFEDYYWLTEDGQVYNDERQNFLKMASHYRYVLMLKTGKTKTISLKTLYKLVYHKNYCIDNIRDLEQEEWREIKGTQKKYYVSNKGRIKSLCDYESIIMKPYKTKKGYCKISIKINNKKRQFFVHTLVAEYFWEVCGKPKDDTWQIHHLDNNKSNNCSNNLIYVSKEQHYNLHYKKGENKKNGTNNL